MKLVEEGTHKKKIIKCIARVSVEEDIADSVELLVDNGADLSVIIEEGLKAFKVVEKAKKIKKAIAEKSSGDDIQDDIDNIVSE